MNKNILIIFIILIFFLFGSLLIFFGNSLNSEIQVTLNETSSNIHTTYLQHILLNNRNDLIQGNLRSFRIQMAKLSSEGAFDEFVVIQNGEAIDSSMQFNSQIEENFNIIKIPIYFDSEQNNKFADVHFYLNKIQYESWSSKISKILAKFELSIAFLFVFFFLTGSALIFIGSKTLNQIMLKKLNGEKLILNLWQQITELIWRPMLQELNKHYLDLIKNIELQKKLEIENKSLEATKTLARSVAHDIRSPLTALNLLTQNTITFTENHKELLVAATLRIKNIADDLLLQSNNKEKQEENSEINLASVIRTIIQEKNIEHRGHSISASNNLMDNEIKIVANPSKLLRAFSNIINNSIEASQNNSNIQINLNLNDQNNFEIKIIDHGRGMTPEQLENLGKFEWSSKESGHGIGFKSSLEYIKNIGGNIHVSSQIGHGTTVSVLIPKAK